MERSTSSGSLCVEGEEVGRVVGGGSCHGINNMLNYGLRLRNEQAEGKAYQVGFVCQRDW